MGHSDEEKNTPKKNRNYFIENLMTVLHDSYDAIVEISKAKTELIEHD